MKVVGMVATLMVLCVGSWAHFHYAAIVEELKNSHGLPAEDAYGPFDSVWGYFDSAWESFDAYSNSSKDCPRPDLSSGVEANPHLVDAK